MRHRLHNVIVACLLIVSIGGHWALLQSVAWMGMLVSYSQNDSFSAAVEKTFDGKHPCKLCRAVDQGKRSEQKKSFVKSELKIDWMLAEQPSLTWMPASVDAPRAADDRNFLVFVSPPIPPPKAA